MSLVTRWATVQNHLSVSLADFLAEALPEVGGTQWWKFYVLQQLTPSQRKSVESLPPFQMHELDLAALLRIAERNWSELVVKKSLKREGRALLEELKEVRNRHAHAPAGGVPLDDYVRDVDTVNRLLKMISAKAEVLSEISSLYRQLLLEVAAGAAAPKTDYEPDPFVPTDGTNYPDETDWQVPDDISLGPAYTSTDGNWIVDPSSDVKKVQAAVETATYVGIDFGTSTSVVSIVRMEKNGQMKAQTLEIDQPEELGGTISHHLVNTVLAWHNENLFFGKDAYRLRQELFEGRNIFSSFKMKLGVDLGPNYPETALAKGKHSIVIEDANDAAREFFRQLKKGIKKTVTKEKLPTNLHYAVTVPASFEANQRRDLLKSMKEAGLPVSSSCLIDEPNAAFLSFLHESGQNKTDRSFIDRLSQGPTNILIYDFGAGTCDVSILEVHIGKGTISSRNRAISRFTALGGDDIDRAIAREILMPQLIANRPEFDPEIRDIEERIIPRLQPTAERLKIASIKWLTERKISSLRLIREQKLEPFSDLPMPTFKIRGHELKLENPTLTLGQLADTIAPFVNNYNPELSTAHVFSPVDDALDKSGLTGEHLEAVLFIGGSAANPIGRNSVMSHQPTKVKEIVPGDLRIHVSVGAALHSLGFHGFNFDFIKPITSEAIFVVVRGGKLETIIPASSLVPSSPRFKTRLHIEKSEQKSVELPICVSNESKLLGLLKVEAPNTLGFKAGAEIIISAAITQEKLLDIKAEVDGITIEATLLSPLANRELDPAETKMLEAKQIFNTALLESHGRPPKDVVIRYATAALEAEAFEIAADMFAAVERLDPSADHATNICYAYSRAGRDERSSDWAQIAHERNPTATTAYNLSCDKTGSERENFLNQSIELDPELAIALLALGRILNARGHGQGNSMIEKSIRIYERELVKHEITKDDCRNLIMAAEILDRSEVWDRAKARLETFLSSASLYDEGNLASSSEPELSLIMQKKRW